MAAELHLSSRLRRRPRRLRLRPKRRLHRLRPRLLLPRPSPSTSESVTPRGPRETFAAARPALTPRAAGAVYNTRQNLTRRMPSATGQRGEAAEEQEALTLNRLLRT